MAGVLLGCAASAGAASAPSVETPPETFDIWEFQVEGNTLMPATDIERAVYPHLGPAKSIVEVTAAQQQLEALYHSRGFGTVLVDIPEQDVVGGVIQLRVTEASVGRINVTGSRYFSLGKIKAGVPSLAVGSAPHLPAVQRELTALAGLSSDRIITPVLRPAKTPGKLDVELRVKDELPLHGSVQLDNRYSADTTPLRLSAALRYDNLWQRGHSLGVAYLVSPQASKEVEVFSANYLWRFEHLDHLLALYGVNSNSTIDTLGTLGVYGPGAIVGFSYTIPLAPAANYFHSVAMGLAYKDFGESINLDFSQSGDGAAAQDVLDSPISYTALNADYTGTYFGKNTESNFAVSLNLGLRGLGNTAKEFERKRAYAIPNWGYLRMRIDHERPLFGDVRLFSQIEGQAANSALISNEAYAAGGADNVRGYLESEKQGDDALHASFELRYPSWRPAGWLAFKRFDLFAFTDATGLRSYDVLPGTSDTALLWSTGIGLRLTGFETLNAQLAWAYALRDCERTLAGDNRLLFALGYEF